MRNKIFFNRRGGGFRGGVTGEGEPDWWGRRAGENIDVFIFVVKLINGIFGPAIVAVDAL